MDLDLENGIGATYRENSRLGGNDVSHRNIPKQVNFSRATRYFCYDREIALFCRKTLSGLPSANQD